jgi:hypothetical protein
MTFDEFWKQYNGCPMCREVKSYRAGASNAWYYQQHRLDIAVNALKELDTIVFTAFSGEVMPRHIIEDALANIQTGSHPADKT